MVYQQPKNIHKGIMLLRNNATRISFDVYNT